MIIMKFGGTSVGSAERIRKAAEIIKSSLERKPVVVVSAVAKMTDALTRLAKAASEGQGDEIFEEIKKTHYEIINELGIDKNILETDFAELSNYVGNMRAEKKINDAALDKNIRRASKQHRA